MLKQAYGNTQLARRLLWLTGYADALFLFTSCCMTASGAANLLWFLFILAVANLVLVVYAVRQGVVFEWFGEKKFIQPTLRCVRGNGQAFTGLITPLSGQKLEDFTKEAEAFALAFNVMH